MARERIELLLDRDSPFLEICPLTAWGTDFALGGSLISGIGVVSGVECVITANEPTMRGGSINPYGARKSGAHDGDLRAEPAAADQPHRIRRRGPAATRRRSSCRAAAASAS